MVHWIVDGQTSPPSAINLYIFSDARLDCWGGTWIDQSVRLHQVAWGSLRRQELSKRVNIRKLCHSETSRMATYLWLISHIPKICNPILYTMVWFMNIQRSSKHFGVKKGNPVSLDRIGTHIETERIEASGLQTTSPWSSIATEVSQNGQANLHLKPL